MQTTINWEMYISYLILPLSQVDFKKTTRMYKNSQKPQIIHIEYCWNPGIHIIDIQASVKNL